MQPPSQQPVNGFDTHSDNGNHFQEAQDAIISMEQDSVRTNLRRIGTVNESVNQALHAINSERVSNMAEIPQTDLDLAIRNMAEILQKLI